MANFRLVVQPAGAGIPLRADSRDMNIEFKSVFIGDDKLQILQDGAGVSARLKILSNLTMPDAINNDEAATWGQVLNLVTNELGDLEWQPSVKSIEGTPPILPSEGDRYLIKAPTSGVWISHEEQLVEWKNGNWEYSTNTIGTFVSVDDEADGIYLYSGTAWEKKRFEALTASQGLVRIGDDFQIAGSGVTEDKIATGAVTNTKIGNGAVDANKLSNGAVETDKIKDAAVTSAKIGLKEVKTPNIDDKAVDTEQIADSAIEALQLADNSVEGSKLSSAYRERIGVAPDNTYEEYTSTNIIDELYTYPQALSALDNILFTLNNQNPQEFYYVASAGETQITSPSFTWNPSNAVYDLLITVNGKKQSQGVGFDFVKTSSSELTFSYPLAEGAEVAVRMERASVSTPNTIKIRKNGAAITSYCTTLNFLGTNIAVADIGAGIVNISVSGGGGGGTSGTYTVIYYEVTTDDELAKFLTLPILPSDPSNVSVDIVGGPLQRPNEDFTIEGDVVSWEDLGWDNVIAAGDVIRFEYMA